MNRAKHPVFLAGGLNAARSFAFLDSSAGLECEPMRQRLLALWVDGAKFCEILNLDADLKRE